MSISSALREYYHGGGIAHFLLKPPVFFYRIIWQYVIPDAMLARYLFRKAHGYSLDLNNVRTLNEKIQWLKLYDRRPEYAQYVDKFDVKDHVADIIGADFIIPTLACDEDANTIPFETFPRPFIIKPTHLSGEIIVVSNNDQMDWTSVRKRCANWKKKNVYRNTREYQYKNLTPRVIVEKLLVDTDGSMPKDYKFHCINGKIVAIQVDIDRFAGHSRNFYDSSWNQLPFTWSRHDGDNPLWPSGRNIEKPKHMEQLCQLTEKLASTFSYVRVDWYYVNDQIFFGELTLHHGNGCERIMPFAWDEKLGDMLNLPTL